MENTTTVNTVLEKKLDSWYSGDMKNFVAPQEITVTITLKEYRELVEKNAVCQDAIDKANKDKYTRDNENAALREEIAKLKAEIYEMQKATEKGDN